MVMRRLLIGALLPVALMAPAGADETETPVPDPTSEELFTITDPEVVESSGLVAQDGLFVTVNDSGGSARIFTIDPATGDTIGTTRWPLAVYDPEGLAPAGDGTVWVGDIGDNRGARETIQVHRVSSGRGETTELLESYELDYPDGQHDAEGLLRHPQTGRLYVVSKEVVGRLYAVPEQPDPDGTNRLRGAGAVMGMATGGDFFPDGNHLMIRGYSNATIYTWPDLDEVAVVKLPHQPQGEALAIDEDGEIYLSTEGLNQPVLRLDLPDELRQTVLGIEPPTGPDPAESTDAAEDKPLWPYLFVAGMGLIVLYGAVRLVRGGFFSDD